jgi:hypothetical protein
MKGDRYAAIFRGPDFLEHIQTWIDDEGENGPAEKDLRAIAPYWATSVEVFKLYSSYTITTTTLKYRRVKSS